MSQDSDTPNAEMVAATSESRVSSSIESERIRHDITDLTERARSTHPRIVPVFARYLADQSNLFTGYSTMRRALARGEYTIRSHDVATSWAPPKPALDATTSRKVLIVEHESTNRVLMEKILDIGGYHCVLARDGREALAMFDRERPDLVVTDISMPIMDGLAATAAMRSHPYGKHVPIIAVSGHALHEDREHALRQGCTEYLVKPFRPQELLSVVARLLAGERG